KVLVFDLDGTMMKTDFYVKPTEEACVEIKRALSDHSPTLAEIKRRHAELDKQMIYMKNPDTGRLYYYTKPRFPTSLCKIYEILCKEAGIDLNVQVIRRLYSIGLQAFRQDRYVRKIKPEVAHVLKFLKEKGDTLVIITKGDKKIQGDKIKALKKAGLLKYFDAVFIPIDSKYSDFKLVKSRYKGSSYYSIGDTYADDIIPAIKAGYRGIWIPYEFNWKEIGKVKQINRRRSKRMSKRYSNLIEIVENYDKL
ncbi:HAD family hydrolase, partial [Patescibacteria group bacterium]|nr:HAD family hydrolase [Patescibacteria group bacterium]